jgi:hypothetical protein
MTKKQVIEIATGLGFRLDLDRYNEKDKQWIRFELKEELDEADLRWIWFKDQTLEWNLERGAQILFKAGQKAFKQRLNEYVDL